MPPEKIKNMSQSELVREIITVEELMKGGMRKEAAEDLMKKREEMINGLADKLSEEQVKGLEHYVMEKTEVGNERLPIDFEEKKKYYLARILVQNTAKLN